MIFQKFMLKRLNIGAKYFCTKSKNDALVKKYLIIDTHAVVQDLKMTEFSDSQSVGLKNFAIHLLDIQTNLMEGMDKSFLKKQEFDIYNQKLTSDIENIRRDLLNASLENVNNIKYENEKLKMELQLLRQQLKEEIDKTNNMMSLNMNLEKSRTGDEHNQIRSEIIKTQNRIDTQVANLRTSFEQYRNDILKYAVGTVITTVGLCISIYRLWIYK